MKRFLFGLFGFSVVFLIAGPAFAQDAVPPTNAMIKACAAIGLGIAAFGGALGQGKTAAAALEGIARNPGAQNKIFTPMILGLALIESLVIYAFVIALIS